MGQSPAASLGPQAAPISSHQDREGALQEQELGWTESEVQLHSVLGFNGMSP